MDPQANKSLFRKWIRDPLAGQLKQGVSPEKIAQSLAWAAALGIFPILGTTSFLCAIIGMRLRLNHIAMQTLNWIMYPVQIALIIPYLKLGNWIFLQTDMNLSLIEISRQFADNFLAATADLGGLALRGIGAWLITAPVIIYPLRRILNVPIRHLAEKMHVRRTEP